MIPEVPTIKSYFLNICEKKKKFLETTCIYVVKINSLMFNNHMQMTRAIYPFPDSRLLDSKS